MFGYHKARRERKRLKRSQDELNQKNKQFEEGAPERERKALEMQKTQAGETATKSAADRKAAREEARADTEAFFNKEVQGLDPEKRKAMQYEANKGIQRAHQATNRKLLGEQSQRGIRGQGGVGYAQQRDLQKMAMEAEGGVARDLTKLDRDLALKKQAAIFAGGEGGAAQAQLDKQLALDELQLADERKRQRAFEDQFYKQWSRMSG